MIPLIKSTFYNEKQTKSKLLRFISKAKYLSFGKECQEFEKNFASFQKRKYCVFVNSGSSANLALIQALLNLKRIKKGDKIGFSALTWSTNVMPLIELGLQPVPIDVEIDTLNISSNTFKKTLRKHRIKALFLTNLLGFCDDIDKIQKICKTKKILFLEDNCESLGTLYKKQLLGNFSNASTFSFYVGHHMSTIEGGAICTNDNDLATMLRIVRAHGWDRNLSSKDQVSLRNQHRVNSTFYSRYTFYDLGYNLRPTEINGFIGNIQLSFINEIIKKRNKNFLFIAKHIYSNQKKYYPIRYDHIQFLSNFAVPVVCRSRKERDALVAACNQRVEIRPIVGGDMTQQPFFKKYSSLLSENPNARLVHKQGLYFGNNPEMTQQELNTIIRIFAK